ncbi:phage holin, lambda family [Vibrio quintilis]|uniref:Phage holin family (Lysis protein S) n=1 Tax=Vibrio quintilis TaxID=1117707 RepID=A0A1M7YXR0_9VIBR|nr:phage holin, lambda family [Vibrio quintilis]SHO57333.1 Phage holin family (Lysis protein S) [Vibrio quintilis]
MDINISLDVNSSFELIRSFFKGDSIILSLLTSFFLATVRVIYSGGGLSEIIFEGIMCGCLTLISVSIIEYFGISNQFTVSIGGFIGFMGANKISSWINRFISGKIS